MSKLFDALNTTEMIAFAKTDAKMLPLIDEEMWRRREIDGSFMAFLHTSQNLLKYSFDMAKEDDVATVAAFIDEHVGKQVAAAAAEHVPWVVPTDPAKKKQLIIDDFRASAKRLKMDVDSV